MVYSFEKGFGYLSVLKAKIILNIKETRNIRHGRNI